MSLETEELELFLDCFGNINGRKIFKYLMHCKQFVVNSDRDQVNNGTVGTKRIHWCSFVIHVYIDSSEWQIP